MEVVDTDVPLHTITIRGQLSGELIKIRSVNIFSINQYELKQNLHILDDSILTQGTKIEITIRILSDESGVAEYPSEMKSVCTVNEGKLKS